MTTTDANNTTFAREIEGITRPTLRYLQLSRRNKWPGDKLDDYLRWAMLCTKQEKVLRDTLKPLAELQEEEKAGEAIYANLQDMMNRMQFEDLRGFGR